MINPLKSARSFAHTVVLTAVAAAGFNISSSVILPSAAEAKSPEACVQKVMKGDVNWGGGTTWQRKNAVALCKDAKDHNARTTCFTSTVAGGTSWSKAIKQCYPIGLQASRGGSNGIINSRNVGVVRFGGGSFEKRGGKWVETGSSG